MVLDVLMEEKILLISSCKTKERIVCCLKSTERFFAGSRVVSKHMKTWLYCFYLYPLWGVQDNSDQRRKVENIYSFL